MHSDVDGITDRFDNCINGTNPPPAGFSQSQRDLNADGVSDITDTNLVGSKFRKVGGSPFAAPGYEGRFDLNFDSAIDSTDINLVGGTFGKRC